LEKPIAANPQSLLISVLLLFRLDSTTKNEARA
jgi:hypothetical protein